MNCVLWPRDGCKEEMLKENNTKEEILMFEFAVERMQTMPGRHFKNSPFHCLPELNC